MKIYKTKNTTELDITTTTKKKRCAICTET